MPFSHHSHSGQFCSHATNTLEEVVKHAIEKRMEVFALTEHMPRKEEDLYPEEIATSVTEAKLFTLFEAYFQEALRLQKAYASQIKLLIGLEIDWIRSSSKTFIDGLLDTYQFDLFVGSVHHVHTIPIDHSHELYVKAWDQSGGIEKKLFEQYFDLQYEMLKALKPPIVGHFDLIRLKSTNPDASFMRWGSLWQKILRNLDYISEYGGIIELNSAAMRKGLKEPYPQAEICKAFLAKGGQFTLSDDSHGIDQIGAKYHELLEFAEMTGITTIAHFEKGTASKDDRFPGVFTQTVSVADLKTHAFFT